VVHADHVWSYDRAHVRAIRQSEGPTLATTPTRHQSPSRSQLNRAQPKRRPCQDASFAERSPTACSSNATGDDLLNDSTLRNFQDHLIKPGRSVHPVLNDTRPLDIAPRRMSPKQPQRATLAMENGGCRIARPWKAATSYASGVNARGSVVAHNLLSTTGQQTTC
jgi:hypothetical protein